MSVSSSVCVWIINGVMKSEFPQNKGKKCYSRDGAFVRRIITPPPCSSAACFRRGGLALCRLLLCLLLRTIKRAGDGRVYFLLPRPRLTNSLFPRRRTTTQMFERLSPPSASAFGANDGVVVIKPSRLDAFIAENLREEKITRGAVARSIANGNVFVNGTKTMKKTYKVQRGDVIRLTIERAKSLTAEPEDIKLDVIYEDEDVIVINKPAGMVVHPAPGHSSGTLVNALLYHCGCPALVVQEGRKIPKSLDFAEVQNEEEEDDDDDDDDDDEIMPYLGPEEEDTTVRPGIVHRLDKGTSGLLVCAKNGAAHQHLCDQFAARSVRRLYVALVLGHPNPSAGVVEEPIGRDPKNRLRMSIASSLRTGRFARSNYRTLETFPTSADTATSASLVEWKLDTGRTHQIRVHSKFLGCGILGDETYDGNKERVKKQLLNNPGIKKVNAEAVGKRSVRPMLHARTIGFTHPRTGESLDFSREPPQDFLEVLDALKKC